MMRPVCICHRGALLCSEADLMPWCFAALEKRVRERVREHMCSINPAKKDAAAAAAAAAAAGSSFEARPQRCNKAAHCGSNKTKARQAALSPAVQPEKQPASRVPLEAPIPPRDQAACPQQTPAHAELPPQNTAKQSRGHIPGDRDDSTSREQAVSAESQAAQQTAQAKKQKAARRKAAKNKAANLQTKPSASSDGQSTPDSSSQKEQHEQVAAAEVPAVASAKAVTQPPTTQQIPERPSSHGQTAPQTPPENTQPLQQSTSENVQSAGSSTAADARPRRPCLPVPDMPHGWPTDARPAPVRLSKTTLQHSQSSNDPSRPPPLQTLLPTSAPRSDDIQVKNSRELANLCLLGTYIYTGD